MRLESLRHRADFRRVSSHGRFARVGGIKVQWLRNNLDHNRYGIAATTAVGGAVIRNRMRRWARELLRTWDAQLTQGIDVVVLAFHREAVTDFRHFTESLSAALMRLRIAEEPLAG